MKRQLDRLKGKRLVTGDFNLMTKNEICINETSTGVEVKEIGIDGKIKDLVGSGGGYEYIDLSGADETTKMAATMISVAGRYEMEDGQKGLATTAMLLMESSSYKSRMTAVCVDFSIKVAGAMTGGEFWLIPDLLSSLGVADIIAALPRITKEEFYNLNSSDNSDESTVKEGDLLYYTLGDVSFNSIRDITDNITQIAVGRGENTSTASIIYLDRFIDIQDVTINKGDDYVTIYTSNYCVIDMPAFVYKVGSDLKTAEDIIGNSSITRITKEEYDNIF